MTSSWSNITNLVLFTGSPCRDPELSVFCHQWLQFQGGVDCGLDRILLWSGLSIEHCFACIAGGEYTDQESAALDGVHWRVPMLAEVDTFVNLLGEVVTYLEKEFPITGKLHFEPIVELRFLMVSGIWKLSLRPSSFIN